MDDSGTKVLPKQHPPPPPNTILPIDIDQEIQHFLQEDGGTSEELRVNEIEGAQQRDALPPIMKEILPAVTPKAEKTMEGMAQRYNEKNSHYEDGFFIVLDQQQLSVYEGKSKEGKLLHQFKFPHGSEYQFLYESKKLTISGQKGHDVKMIILGEQLFINMLMEWYNTKLFSDFKRDPGDRYGYPENKNYCIMMNPLSFKEFGNVYNTKFMTPFQYYSNVMIQLQKIQDDRKPQIKIGVEFKHYYRPNRLMKSQKQEFDQKIEDHMKNRKFHQWAPSRDWSRLFVMSVIINELDEYIMYLEFYDFNLEKYNILSSPQRINHLSQLLRPQWIKEVCYAFDMNNLQIQASFTGYHIAVKKDNQRVYLFAFNNDWTLARQVEMNLQDAKIEIITIACSRLHIKSDGLYYEYGWEFEQGLDGWSDIEDVTLAQHFTKTDIQNIINCGIYDILIFEKHVIIFNNINPDNEFDELVVNEDILQLLQSQKFIQLDDHSIACLPLTLQEGGNKIQIIEISQDNLVKRDRDEIYLEVYLRSPWKETVISDCQFNLIKFKENEFAALIVTSPNKKEYFYQYYRMLSENYFTLSIQKSQSDYISLPQIPHLPFVTLNGNLFINCDNYHTKNQIELDILTDESEILNQDQDNFYSQELEVFDSSFKKCLQTLIEEKINDIEKERQFIIDKCIQSDQKYYSIEIPEIKTLVTITQDAENSRILILFPKYNFIQLKHLYLEESMRYMEHKLIYQDNSYYLTIILLRREYILWDITIKIHDQIVELDPYLGMIGRFIMEMNSSQSPLISHLSSDMTLSLIINEEKNNEVPRYQSFKKYIKSDSTWHEYDQFKYLKFSISKMEATVSQVIQVIYSVAKRQSIKITDPILYDFWSIITKNTNFTRQEETYIFAFKDNIMLFSQKRDEVSILDDTLTVISTVVLNLTAPLLRIVSTKDSGVAECTDALNNKFPFPIMHNQWKREIQEEILNKYSKDFRQPMPFYFGLHQNFYTDLDLKNKKLFFYKSFQDKKDKNILARIEVIAQRDSFIDKIIRSKERKNIEDIMNETENDLLLSYNINKRMNLITGTKNHSEKDLIYSVLFKRLEIAEYQDLPMLIYNISLDKLNSYETILDVLVRNKAIKLAQLIISIAIKQDQNGVIFNNLGPYLSIFSANELQMFLGSQMFFFKISSDYYKEYQILEDTFFWPESDYNNFDDIKNNIKNIEKKMLSENYYDEKKLYDSGIPIEYYVINLMQLNSYRYIELSAGDHREVTQMMNKLLEIDATILERESIQIIIDFKWNSYAQKFFIAQLFLFICFIISFIFDVVAVSQNSHVFQSDDKNQFIPRIIQIAIIIPFGIYEIANIFVDIKRYFKNFWNINDLLLTIVHTIYFIMTYAQSDSQYALKILQLLIVILSFIKFSFLIRIWTRVSFLVRMLIVVFKELLIFLFYFLLVIGCLTVMAQIIIKESGDNYNGIKVAAYFVIVLRQAIGDYDTSSIIEGTRDFKILAWLLWLIILIIGNIVFMNFIIAVVSESYENCMEKKIQLIYQAKLEMIQECEDLMPEILFYIKNWFPKFIIIRREQGSSQGGDNSDEWQGFVRQMKRHLEHETSRLNEMFIQNIKRSTDSTKKELDIIKKEQKDTAVKTADQINEIKEILSAVYKDQIAAINSKN